MDSVETKPKRKKTGGRTKGTPNKKTVWLRESLDAVGLSWELELKKAFESKDYKMIELLQGFMPYLNPKIKERDVEQAPQEPAPSSDPADINNLLQLVKTDGS